MREELKKPLLEVVKILGITVVVYIFMRFLIPLVIPFLIALLIAKLLHPIVEKLHKKIRLKKGIVSTLVLLLFLGISGGILWFALKSIFYQIADFASNVSDIPQAFMDFWEDVCERLEEMTGIHADVLKEKIMDAINPIVERIRGNFLPNLMTNSVAWLKNILVFSGLCIIVGVSTLLLLKDYDKMRSTLKKGPLGSASLRIASRVYKAGGGYFRAQLIIMLTISIVCIMSLFICGHSFALVAGIGIGFCDALPFLGTGTVFIPWAMLEIFQGQYMAAAVYAIIYTICSIIREFLEPKLIGDKLGVHPLVILISIYMGLKIYGLWGFFLGPLSFIMVREIWLEFKEKRVDNGIFIS
jgi:sporulation integral membrane protein YtvI